MTTTGLPVTIEMYQWLVTHAAEHETWFDKTHEDYRIIYQFLTGSHNLNVTQTSELNETVESFLLWFFILVVSFDGGLFTESITQFNATKDRVTITWQSNIHHAMSLNTWDRSTRLAINYIVESACSIRSATDNIDNVIPPLMNYLRYYNHRLSDILTGTNAISPNTDISRIIAKDESVLFSILATLDLQELQAFYLKVSKIFPEALSIEGPSGPVSLQRFFANTAVSELLIIDKVKMHYNIQLFSEISEEYKKQLKDKTSSFIERHTRSSTDRVTICQTLDEVVISQLKPRHQLLEMVLQQYS
jgi:hypothetical protein